MKAPVRARNRSRRSVISTEKKGIVRAHQTIAHKTSISDTLLSRRARISIQEAKTARLAYQKQMNEWLSRARHLLEQNSSLNESELAIRLRVPMKTARAIWLQVPRIKKIMRWEERKKNRR